MFPSLNCEKIVQAHTKLLQRWKPQLDLQRPCKDVHISDTKMDLALAARSQPRTGPKSTPPKCSPQMLEH